MLKSSKNKHGHRAFTLTSDTVLSEIITECQISRPYHPFLQRGQPQPKYETVRALWDTGATNSVVTQTLIDRLGLIPFMPVVNIHANGSTPGWAYKVNLILPNDVQGILWNVTNCVSITGNFDLIIGMDIITKGDFAITNLGGKTTVSYKVPSSHLIDFNDGETLIEQPEKKIETVSANVYAGVSKGSPCPCGSGKKFKRCHGIEV